jgi:hypothetical protein
MKDIIGYHNKHLAGKISNYIAFFEKCGYLLSNKRFIHSPADKKARALRSSAGRVRKLDCGILERDY